MKEDISDGTFVIGLIAIIFFAIGGFIITQTLKLNLFEFFALLAGTFIFLIGIVGFIEISKNKKEQKEFEAKIAELKKQLISQFPEYEVKEDDEL